MEKQRLKLKELKKVSLLQQIVKFKIYYQILILIILH